MKNFRSIKDYNEFMGYKRPKKELIDIVDYSEYEDLRLSCKAMSTEFYILAFKRSMTDLSWYGNTEYDPDSAFLYLIQPDQVYQWESEQLWKGYQITVAPVLLREYNLDFSFFNYQTNEALFLSADEQNHIETLYQQILIEYKKDNYELDLLIAYSNLIFTYINQCYKRQFNSRQPLYNQIIVEFKKELNSYYSEFPKPLPSVNHFASSLNLSTNYFGDLVKHQTGKTATEIIQEKIIQEAKQQLKKSNLTIAEIGYQLGFEYPTYFARLFKKNTGLSPTEFRK